MHTMTTSQLQTCRVHQTHLSSVWHSLNIGIASHLHRTILCGNTIALSAYVRHSLFRSDCSVRVIAGSVRSIQV